MGLGGELRHGFGYGLRHAAGLLRRKACRFQAACQFQSIKRRCHEGGDQLFSANTVPARCSEPQMNTRPSALWPRKSCNAATTEGAANAGIPTALAAAAIA